VSNPIWAAVLHLTGSFIVVFNSARLVRKGEELEHYQPATVEPPASADGQKPGAELTPKLA
jgi:hypothetical protein